MKAPQSFRVLNRIGRWSLAPVLAFALAACGGSDDEPPAAAPTTATLSAAMSGDQEPTATLTGALGTGSLTLESPSRRLSGSITLDGLTATMAHVHVGEAGVNGPVIVELSETVAGSGVWAVPANAPPLTEPQAAAFAAGGLYFNAHSAENPGGEVRGQIGRQVFAAQVSARQEVPTNGSAALGNGVLSFDPVTKAFAGRLTLTGITAVAAHIHSGALGANGPVLFELTQTTAGSGVWVSATGATLSDAQITALNAGALYFNAHSTAFPAGEIRGQIGRNVRFASLNAAQEVPTNASTATGTGTLVIDPTTRAASGSITLTGITAVAAHIHLAAEGSNGPVIVNLTGGAGGVWTVPSNTTLTSAQLKAYKQGNLYFNVHSATFPAGEIRGQIR